MFLSAAILSIANIDSLMHEDNQGQKFARSQMKIAKDRLRQRLEVSVPKVKAGGLLNMMRDSLAQDELGETLPFAGLATLEPLNKVLQKGVKHFERTVYRSPDHRGESGYDVVQYDIEHVGGHRSTILAYLDRPLLTSSRDVGAEDTRIPIVVIVGGEGEKSAYTMYRSGHLLEQYSLDSGDASGLIAQRIAASVPFFSVAR